ncbi:MAG: hypothetical protein V7640_2688 [Betaproteobacteria bacterium]|jgi:hypothetical protein
MDQVSCALSASAVRPARQVCNCNDHSRQNSCYVRCRVDAAAQWDQCSKLYVEGPRTVPSQSA